jgi:hypothetical protein
LFCLLTTIAEVIAGGVAFAVGIFWFGWTGYRADIHWIVPTISGILIGFGLLSIFLQALNYLVDAYLMASRAAGTPFEKRFADYLDSLPPPRLQRTPSCVVCVVPRSRFSQGKCSTAWESSGRLPC